MVGANLLAPKVDFGSANTRRSLNVRGRNQRNATTNRQYIYGQVKAGGTVAYMGTSGTDNEFLHMVLVHCDHEVEELGDLYVNGEKVDMAAGGEGVLRTTSSTSDRFYQSLYIADHLGGPSQTSADSTLDAATGDINSSDAFKGMAYTYIRMELKQPNDASPDEENAFPSGIPQFQRVIKGMKVYDPREAGHDAADSTTWEYSSNWALCVGHFLQSDFGYGRYGLSYDEINSTELTASANNADETIDELWTARSDSETLKTTGYTRSLSGWLIQNWDTTGTTGVGAPSLAGKVAGDTVTDGDITWTLWKASTNSANRYELNGMVDSHEDPIEVLRKMKTAASGMVEYVGGEWIIRSGRYIAPTITLSESDFSSGISGTTKDDRTNAVNTVKGVIVDKLDSYQVIDAPSVTNSTFVTEDGGVESVKEMELMYTNSHKTAQRLFKIELNKARQSITHKASFTSKAMQLQVGDTFQLNFAKYGYVNKVFEVWSHQLVVSDGALMVEMEFRETAANVYDWDHTTDETALDPSPNTTLPSPFTVPSGPTPTITSGTSTLVQTADGTISPTMHVDWTPATDSNVIAYELRWERFTNQYEYMTVNGQSSSTAVIGGVVEGSTYGVQIRCITPLKIGLWGTSVDHDVVGKSAAPTAPTGFAAAATVEGVKLTMDEHPDIDFKQFLIFQNTNNSKPGAHSYTTTDTTKALTGLTAGQTYHFWLEAEDTTGHKTAAASGVNATPTATAAGDVTGLGALATEDTVDLTTTGGGGVSGVLPTSNTEATDNGATINTSGNVDASIDFTASGAIKHGKTSSDDASNAGFWLGEDGASDYDFHIGDADNSLKWDGSASTLTVQGDLTAGSIDIGTGFSRTQIANTGVSSWAGGRIQINASDSAFGDVGQRWTGSPIESIWIDCNTTTLPANLKFGDVNSGSANAFITGQGNAEFKTLDVTTKLDLNSSTIDASNGVGTSGQVLSSTGTATQWVDPGGPWAQTGSDIYYNSGNVGINDSTPSHDLDVNGTGRFTGTLTASGGINGLTLSNGIVGSNFNITGVNQLTINDPGEGIIFQGTTDVSLYAIDDATDSIMNFDNATELRRDGNKVWDAGNAPHDFGESFSGATYQSSGVDLDSYRDLGDHVFYNAGGASTANSPFSSGHAYAWTAGAGDTSSRGLQFASNSSKMYWREMGTPTSWRELLTTDANGNCTASEDLDDVLTFGRSKIGYMGFADHSGFAHYNQATTTGYALLQNSTGYTLLNCGSGRSIYFREGNSTKGYWDGGNDRWRFDGNSTQIGTSATYGKLNVGGSVGVESANGNGYKFFENASNYTIHMSSSGDTTWGGRLDTTSDYNMYFRMSSGTNRGFVFQNSTTETAQITGAGDFHNIGDIYCGGSASIGTTSGGYQLRVEGTGYFGDSLTLGDHGSEGGELVLLDQNNASTQKLTIDVDSSGNSRVFQAGNGGLHLGNITGGTGETRLYCNADLKVQVKSTQTEITDQLYVSGYSGSDSIVTINGIDCGGGMLVQGSLDVDNDLEVSGSKNFRIAHPIRDGHDLRHSCIESPQADLNYRGKATLVDGTAQVDLDLEFGMTAGTFAALNEDVQVFVQNDTGWDAVRGSVSDGVLTITCHNLDSHDSVGWLVIGRRTGIELEIEPKTKIK